MGVIRVLPEKVANQIAAGEVVDRPASVVKELIENALDAGAARIEVGIEGGGADRIRVADDGCGMGREDALLALQRHATSKIREAADLSSIASFGFRGEALPAIASVARLTLTTAAEEGRGTRVTVHGGALRGDEPAAHPRGTTVEVEGLFLNAPVRRKFLRSPSTEASHIAAIVTRLAAAQPAVSFRLRSGGRELLAWPAVPTFRERVAQIVGREEAGLLVPVERRAESMRLEGLASSPSLGRSSARDQHLFVNGRPIRDRRLLHGVQEAYATFLQGGRYPVVYLFLSIPLGEVDVNVHPAKTEVRFQRAGAVHDLVRDGLRAALGAPSAGARRGYGREAPAPSAYSTAVGERRIPEPGVVTAATGEVAEARLFDAVRVAPLAQFRDSYILAAAPEGLVIVDQHAAHERILYDRLSIQDRERGIERQRLLFPVTVELRPEQRQALEAASASLAELGFGIAPFGPATVIVDEVPALLGAGDPSRLVRDLLNEVLEWDRAEGIDRLRHRILATAACHAAVTANERLEGSRMRQILDDLLVDGRQQTCPHGRPAVLRLTMEQIEKEFRRR